MLTKYSPEDYSSITNVVENCRSTKIEDCGVEF